MSSYTDIPQLPTIPEGYKFLKFAVVRTQHERSEQDCKKNDIHKLECLVEQYVLECCVVYACCVDEEGNEQNAIWRVGSSEWESWVPF